MTAGRGIFHPEMPNATDFHVGCFLFPRLGIVLSLPPGIVHSEMPGWEKTRGLQLWVNLPRSVTILLITKLKSIAMAMIMIIS